MSIKRQSTTTTTTPSVQTWNSSHIVCLHTTKTTIYPQSIRVFAKKQNKAVDKELLEIITYTYSIRPIVCRTVAWPSGLRRWFKAPVSSEAWVRIPPLPYSFFPFSVFAKNLCRESKPGHLGESQIP